MEENIPESLTVFAFPASHHRKLCTSNSLERLNREIRRRTRVVSIFPNEAACLRLISAILVEIDEEWQTGKLFLTIQEEVGQHSRSGCGKGDTASLLTPFPQPLPNCKVRSMVDPIVTLSLITQWLKC